MSAPLRIPGLYQPKGRVYWYRVRIGRELYRGSLDTMDFGEAVRRLEKQRRILQTDQGLNQIRHAGRAYIAARQKGGAFSDPTYAKRHLEEFISVSKLTKLPQITKGEVERFYHKMQDHPDRSEETAQKYVNTIRGFLRWCSDTGKIAFNPAEGLRMATVKRGTKRQFLTRNETDTLFAACDRDDLRYILFAGIHAGLRKGEIIESKPSWFNFEAGEDGQIWIPDDPEEFRPKDEESRAVPLSPQFRAFLGNYPMDGKWMVAPNKEPGNYRYRYEPKKALNALYKKAGIMKKNDPEKHVEGFHILRRTFASRLVSNGVSVYKVAKWLGDGVQVVQDHYGHLDQDYSREIAKGL